MPMYKNTKFTVLVFSLILVVSGIAQTQIRGRVLDQSTAQPLSGADVYLKKHQIGSVTDIDGYFRIDIKKRPDKDTLIVSYLGYNSYKKPLHEFKNNTIIYLTAGSLTLGESIEIYGERIDLSRQEIPHMKEEIGLSELERYGTSEIGDIFKKMPSVRIQGNDLDGRHIQIRGSHPSEVNVYFDGVLMNDVSFDNAADLSLIPTESIYKMEVLKGANLPLLGNGAFGGVLNIHSRRSTAKEGMLKAKMGTFDQKHYIGYLNYPLIKNLIISYFGQYNEMKPEIEYFPGERFSEKTGSDLLQSYKQNHNLNIDYFGSLGQFRVKFFNYMFDYDKPSWSSSRKSLLTAFSYNSYNDLNITVSHIISDDEVERFVLESNRNISAYETQRLNFRISKKFDFNKVELQTLSEYFHDELTDLSKLKTDDVTRTYYKTQLYDNRIAASGVISFADQYDSTGSLNWRLYLGPRFDITASNYKDFTLTWGVQANYKRNGWHYMPYVNSGKNVKYPTLLESAYVSDIFIATGSDTMRQGLEPEYNNSIEIGLKANRQLYPGFIKDINFSLAYFKNTSFNKILRRPLGDFITQRQSGSNTTNGLEASFKAQGILKYSDLALSYTALDISDKELYDYRPEKNLTVQLDLFSDFGLYLTGVYFYEGKSYAWFYDTQTMVRVQKLPSNYDFDATIGYRLNIKKIELNFQFSAYNIMDNAGYNYYNLRKRYLQAALSVKY